MASANISVVIPCRNGEQVLAKQLDALLSQRSDTGFEIIVADNGSTDGTAKVVQTFTQRDRRVRLADASRAVGVNVARNVGVSAASSQFIVLTDADDVVQDHWLDAYRRAFLGGAKLVGGGLDRVLADGTMLRRERKLYPSLMRPNVFANGANCGFTREVFDNLGGFDESFAGGADEVEFFWRAADAGYKLELVPDAVITKFQHTDLDEVFNQVFNFGRGEARLLKKFRPAWLDVSIVLSSIQAAVWGVAWTSGVARRKTTSSLAWNLGLLTEGIRLTL